MTAKNALRLKTNGQIDKIQIENLEDMQAAVGGGYIEALPIDEKTHGMSVYIHEEGRLQEQPLNMTASLFLLRNDVWPGLDSPIHGDVLIMGAVDGEGETTDVDPELYDRLPKFWVEPRFEVYPL